MLAALSACSDKNNGPPIPAAPAQVTITRPNLYPEGRAYDAANNHFLVSFFTGGALGQVKDDGTYTAFADDPQLIGTTGIFVDEPHVLLLRDRAFVDYALTSGLVLGTMCAYIAGSPFVFTQLYGLSTQQYGLLFGLNASGLIAASQLNNWLLRHYSFRQVLRGVTLVALLAGLVLLGLARTGWGGLYGLEVPLFVVVSCVGFAAPNATAGALQQHVAHAGSAASLLGTLSYSTLAALATSALADGTTQPMALVVAICGAMACGLNHWLVGSPPSRPRRLVCPVKPSTL